MGRTRTLRCELRLPQELAAAAAALAESSGRNLEDVVIEALALLLERQGTGASASVEDEAASLLTPASS